jgi:hypothetical protein
MLKLGEVTIIGQQNARRRSDKKAAGEAQPPVIWERIASGGSEPARQMALLITGTACLEGYCDDRGAGVNADR